MLGRHDICSGTDLEWSIWAEPSLTFAIYCTKTPLLEAGILLNQQTSYYRIAGK